MKHLFTFSVFCAALFCAAPAFAQTLKAVDNSQNAGKVEWLDRQINAGNVPFGEDVTRTFRVKNVSNENLLILQVKSTCHCTTVDWDKEPIAPGGVGNVRVTYDGEKEGDFYRIVSIITNFDSMQSIPVALVGKVDKRPEASTGN